MWDLLLKNALVVDFLNNREEVADVAVEDGKIAAVAPGLDGAAREVLDFSGKLLVPGVIDMHVHLRRKWGSPHGHRMCAMAGVTTALDMAGPVDDIIDSIPVTGAGINIATIQSAGGPGTFDTDRPTPAQQRALTEEALDMGAIGIKLVGGHFPMDLDICSQLIQTAQDAKAWVGWHAGNAIHGSNIDGMRDAVECADGRFLHLAHINSYCRGNVRAVMDETLEAIELLKKHPNIYSESYLSPLNGTRLMMRDGVPYSKVTATCLMRCGYSSDAAGMEAAIRDGKAGVVFDNGTLNVLLKGEEGVAHWRAMDTEVAGSFSVNPAMSRYMVATAKRDDGTFVVDSLGTDGGIYPRNVIVEQGMNVVDFGGMTLKEFVLKSSLAGARMLGLANKGHLSVGADADITVIDYAARKAVATIVAGKPVMLEGRLMGQGARVICFERGVKSLKAKGIEPIVIDAIEKGGPLPRIRP